MIIETEILEQMSDGDPWPLPRVVKFISDYKDPWVVPAGQKILREKAARTDFVFVTVTEKGQRRIS